MLLKTDQPFFSKLYLYFFTSESYFSAFCDLITSIFLINRPVNALHAPLITPVTLSWIIPRAPNSFPGYPVVLMGPWGLGPTIPPFPHLCTSYLDCSHPLVLVKFWEEHCYCMSLILADWVWRKMTTIQLWWCTFYGENNILYVSNTGTTYTVVCHINLAE